MKYVALLRGINVGGKSRVEMSRLKHVFETLGCEEVKTYINSGNVVFGSRQKLEPSVVEDAVEREFGVRAKVLLIDATSFRAVNDAIDAAWQNDTQQRTDVMFLWPEVDDASILEKISIHPEFEAARHVPGALIWNIQRQFVTRGGAIKLIKTDAYRQMTIRNCNTVRKLVQLLDS